MFRRISDVFKANVNDLLDKAEDPEKMLKQMVLEMEESVNKATLSVAQAIANEKQLQRRLDAAKKEVESWQHKAQEAIKSNRDDLAKSALQRRLTAEKNVNDLENVLIQASNTASNLKSQLNELKTKLDQARSRKNTLIARSNAAKAQKQLNQSLGGLGDNAFSKFEKLENKIEVMESEAEAFGELHDDATSLEKEFEKLGAPDLDSELEKLKNQLNG